MRVVGSAQRGEGLGGAHHAHGLGLGVEWLQVALLEALYVLELIVACYPFTITQKLKKILDLFPKHFRFVRIEHSVAAPDFSSVYFRICSVKLRYENALSLANFLLLLTIIKGDALGLVVVL